MLLCSLGAALCVGAGGLGGSEGVWAAPEPDPSANLYLRVAERDAGRRVALEAAAREFRPARGEGPAVWLVGAVHIADAAFYKELQAFLDTQDLVLFEGVRPPGLGERPLARDDQAKARATARRIRLLAMLVESYKQQHERYPASLDELAGLPLARELDASRVAVDLWGNAMLYDTAAPRRGRYDIVSLGSDGREGGEGDAADLRLSDQKKLSRKERGLSKGRGIQPRMARILGLTFQGEAMHEATPRWRNSDLSIDEVMERVERSGGDAQVLFDLLAGHGFSARVATAVLGGIAAIPGMQGTLKLMLVEALGTADDDRMEVALGAPAVKVILDDRNDVVVTDLRGLLANPGDARSVGVIYGAAHMPGIERRLIDELGYAPAGEVWRPAISVDLRSMGATLEQARSVRATVRGMLRGPVPPPSEEATTNAP